MRWKDVPGYEGYYKVSDTGLVKSVKRKVMSKTRNGKPRQCIYKEKMLKPFVVERPYGKECYTVRLSKEGNTRKFFVHVLVAMSFIPNPDGKKQVNHKDGNPTNNNVSNLEWSTPKENIQHAFQNGLISTQKPVQMLDPKRLLPLREFKSESEACRAMHVGQGKILSSMKRNGTCAGYKWRYKQNV